MTTEMTTTPIAATFAKVKGEWLALIPASDAAAVDYGTKILITTRAGKETQGVVSAFESVVSGGLVVHYFDASDWQGEASIETNIGWARGVDRGQRERVLGQL